MFLDPAKLLVVLVIAVIVLGPDKLPHLTHQLGAMWGDLRRWRARLESEMRDTFPDLPPTHEVVQAVRSPLAFLDRLADAHESSNPSDLAPPALEPSGAENSAPDAPADPDRANGVSRPPWTDGAPAHNGAGELTAAGGLASESRLEQPQAEGPATAKPGSGFTTSGHAGAKGSGFSGGAPVVPDDPSMN
jgi:Sec-independent protein translocase protein TatA